MYKLAANIEMIKMENDGVVFNKQSEDIYSIDSLGFEILTTIVAPNVSLEDLEAQLLSEYDVSADILHKDLEVFLFQLLRLGIIERDRSE